MAKAVKKAKSVSPKSSKTKPAPKVVVKKPAKPAPKVAPKKPAPVKPAPKAVKPVATAKVAAKSPAPGPKVTVAKAMPVPAKPAPAIAGKTASAPTKPPVTGPVKTAATPAVPAKGAPAKPILGKPAAPALVGKVTSAKPGKKGKKGVPAGPVVITAKPGQILLTALKPSGNGPAKPIVAAPLPPPPEPKKKEKAPIIPIPLPPAPVTSDSKAKKNQAGLSSRELEFYRDLLLAKRRELVGDMTSMEREALRGAGGTLSNLPVHMADMGTDNYEQEFTLGLVEKDRQLLGEINRALAKVHNGTYGICEGTGKPISKARLEAQPWSKFSIEYVRTLELRNFRR